MNHSISLLKRENLIDGKLLFNTKVKAYKGDVELEVLNGQHQGVGTSINVYAVLQCSTKGGDISTTADPRTGGGNPTVSVTGQGRQVGGDVLCTTSI